MESLTHASINGQLSASHEMNDFALTQTQNCFDTEVGGQFWKDWCSGGGGNSGPSICASCIKDPDFTVTKDVDYETNYNMKSPTSLSWSWYGTCEGYTLRRVIDESTIVASSNSSALRAQNVSTAQQAAELRR